MEETLYILIRISLKFVPRGPLDKKLYLVPVLFLIQTGAKPLSEPILTQFIDAYMRHKAELSWIGSINCESNNTCLHTGVNVLKKSIISFNQMYAGIYILRSYHIPSRDYIW